MSSLVRRPSPDSRQSEETFQQKLREIKRMREANKNIAKTQTSNEHSRKTCQNRRVIINGKPAEKLLGSWAKMFSASKRKHYFFHLKTQKSQWTEPKEWKDLLNKEQFGTTVQEEKVVPEERKDVQEEKSVEEEEQKQQMPAFKMKLKDKSATKTINKKELFEDPNEQETNSAKLTHPIPKHDSNGKEAEKSRKSRSRSVSSRSSRSSSSSSSSSSSRSRSNSRSRSRSRSNSRRRRRSRSRSSEGSRKRRRRSYSRSKSPQEKQKESVEAPAPVPMPDMSLVLAAKAKIESQMQAANSLISYLDRKPAHGQIVNPSWMTEYNFPAVLSRCKFPKVSDALHELQSNRSKTRPAPPPPPMELANAKPDELKPLKKALFLQELKQTNNRNRLLAEKLGQTAYKIPDDLWDRSFDQFQIDLMHGVKLEARPHAITEDSTPVYTRTGKVAPKVPFPEDVVRCHAVVQLWGTQVCHCVYANKTYSIERDDKQWKRDLEDCRKFLRENGY